MSTQFFERQETQRSYTRWLVLGFIAAFALVTLVINAVVIVGFIGHPMYVLRHHPEYIVWTSLIVVGTMLIASWHKSSELRAGGAVVARSLGGVPVMPSDDDLKRKRLINIVEEMAIAARIRKPQVFVLPDEPGINAFAAGHSPDEAAVAVTQGALDQLDRDQLQAVIGHEFSHILNGDMRINMRLTAWIFALFVLTDLAVRIMRKRGGGKGAAQVKAVALGVFIAGSVGLFAGRLLQAAVSRRREHLADASSVQFTRNPQALQGAFITMAANPAGSRLQHASAVNVAHMFFAGSEAVWAHKLGTGWFSTHPSLEDRVRALDARVSSTKFRSLVSDQKRKMSASAKQAAAAAGEAEKSPASTATASTDAPMAGFAGAALPIMAAAEFSTSNVAQTTSMTTAKNTQTGQTRRSATLPPESALSLAETLPTGVRMVAGRAIPPDVLRNRLNQDQQAAVIRFVAQAETSNVSVQAAFVATMLAAEPAKWRPQLTKLAPLLGIELLKETQNSVGLVAALAAPARVPALTDLLPALDVMEPAERKKLRAVARAFASTVTNGDLLRFAVTRILEKRLAKAVEAPPPVPLPERATAVCDLYAALAQCRFGAGKQGQNAYRAGLMGMLPPQKWGVFPEALVTPAALDAAMKALAEVHPTGKRSFSEAMARVIAVGGHLTVPQVDLLRAICLVVDCPVPVLPIDVVFEENELGAPATQASAR